MYFQSLFRNPEGHEGNKGTLGVRTVYVWGGACRVLGPLITSCTAILSVFYIWLESNSIWYIFIGLVDFKENIIELPYLVVILFVKFDSSPFLSSVLSFLCSV